MTEDSVRLDKWLWATRFYKTRHLATEAVKGGHVEVNGSRAKPSRAIKAGDSISIRKAPFDYNVEVIDLIEKRVSAKLAREFYMESEQSIEKRTRLKLALKSQAQQILYDPNKPSPRDRRSARERKRRS